MTGNPLWIGHATEFAPGRTKAGGDCPPNLVRTETAHEKSMGSNYAGRSWHDRLARSCPV
jgi:hypothetical protein